MQINTVKQQSEGYLLNGSISVPADGQNRHYVAIQNWMAQGNTPEPEFTLAEELANKKSLKRQEIDAAYNSAIYANIEYMGTTFQADKESQALIAKVLSAGQVPFGFAWYDIENNEIPMIYTELQTLSMTILMRGQTAFVSRRMLKNQVAAAKTVDDLALITVEINP